MSIRTTQRPEGPFPGKFRLRRTVVADRSVPVAERTYPEEPWEWKATQRPPFVVRAERRAANRRARAARKANR